MAAPGLSGLGVSLQRAECHDDEETVPPPRGADGAVSACGSATNARCYSHRTRIGSTTHYRFAGGNRKPLYVLELHEITRLFWPEGATLDPRTDDERRADRRWPDRRKAYLHEALAD